MLAEASAARDAGRIEAIREAGCRIVREAGGKMTVNVPIEILNAQADAIIKGGFVDQVTKKPPEAALTATDVRKLVEEILGIREAAAKPRKREKAA